jgi:NAD(P)-dependent dehydrogenase (short-subunit alcohol dehydrogenase family)
VTAAIHRHPPAPALEHRTALVTGGVGAIGEAIARRFAGEGARVVVADLDAAAAAAVAADIAADYGVETLGIAMDVADAQDTERAAARIESEFDTCDAIVANAGILVLKPALELSAEEWNRVVSVNLGGAFNTAAAFGRRMVAAGRPGTITFSSSLFGVRGGRSNAAYSASKFGIIGLSQSMAAELGDHRIRVNAVCPGQIRTAMIDALLAGRAAASGRTVVEEEADFTRTIPAGGLGTVDDVAKAFVYLSSDQSSYITGQHLVIDGGWQVG